MQGIERTRLRRGRVRPTRRVGIQLLLGALLYAAGANVAAGWVIALAGIVIGVIPWAVVSAWRAAGRVEVRRTVPARAVAGLPVAVTLDVRAPTAASLVVRDDLTGAVGATGDARAGVTLTAQVTLPRGLLTSGRVEATVTDLFGLVRAQAAGEVPLVGRREGEVVEVVPQVPRVRAGALMAPGEDEREGEVLRRGSGPDVIGVREHVPGDPLRSVHWRSTARRGELVVRELADTARPRLRVALAPGTWEPADLDAATDAACGIAASASADGQQVEIAADGRALAWSRMARRHLAGLPPHAGAPPRALRDAPPGGDVVVTLSPATPGVAVDVASARGRRPLGVLDLDADLGTWLSDHLRGGR